MPAAEWRAAVLSFSEAITAFYAASPCKQASEELDAKGYQAFRAEWNRRYNAAKRPA
jgi:hypothetical protein